MDTVTEGRNEPLDRVEEQDRPRCLVTEPQRLGIVPTWWFWSDPDNWALVRAPAAVLVGFITLAVAVAGLPPLLATIVAPLTFLCAVGLLERYIRHAADRGEGPGPNPPKPRAASGS
jgi:hypothetical protein